MNSKTIGIVALVIGIVSLCMSILGQPKERKVGFFDYNKVYNECSLKKSLEEDLEGVVSMRKSELDSMQLELTFLSNRIKAGNEEEGELAQFEGLKERYFTFQGRYEEENIRLKEEYFTQIRKTINEKAQVFAEGKELDYLFAAVGDGSLMYGAKSEDLTEDFLNYMNQ